MATGIVHWYTASITGVTQAAETAPAPVVFDTTRANTLIAFNNMLGDRITGFRVKRVGAATAATYDVHVYKDSAGTVQAFSVYDVAYNALLKWDLFTDDLNTDARAITGLLYVTARGKTGADPLNVDIELSVAQAIGGN